MCDLCNIVDKALHEPDTEPKPIHVDGLCVIVESPGDKAAKDGFQPKVVVRRGHEADPQPPTVSAILEVVKRLYRHRTLWFPQTKDGKAYGLDISKNPPEMFGDKLPFCEWPAHWYILIE
jgi:hypothetical protein